MKRVLMILFALVISIGIGGVYGGMTKVEPYTPTQFTDQLVNKRYVVKKNHKELGHFEEKETALEFAKQKVRSIVIDQNTGEWIYSSLQPYMIITDKTIHDFDSYTSAIKYAKRNNYDELYYKDDQTKIWDSKGTAENVKKLKVPFIQQLPELARGCEVTSLAMMFRYYNINISKLKLAEEVKKETSPYYKDEDGRVHYGNPYEGFVGDMYDFKKEGYGVYHGPITELATKYFGNRVIDITGLEFEDLLEFVERDIPVWIITNATYKPLPEKEFELWHTPTDIVKVTRRMHVIRRGAG